MFPSVASADTIAPTPPLVDPVYVNSNEIEVATDSAATYQWSVQLNGQTITSYDEAQPSYDGQVYHTLILDHIPYHVV